MIVVTDVDITVNDDMASATAATGETDSCENGSSQQTFYKTFIHDLSPCF
jgi:hypothetical protein